MGKVTILPETCKNPISLVGSRAGICYGADISDADKNYKRGLDCIKSNHGRALEFADVHMVLDGYSAKVIREWYTHIGGTPTRLQSSTRYINYDNFECIIPESVKKDDCALRLYETALDDIRNAINRLTSDFGIPREDANMLLPLGMSTKIVDKRNVRNLIDMSHQRECSRAYWEYRQMFKDLKNALCNYSPEWKTLVEMEFKPKCELFGYCTENKGCGRKPTR